MSNSDDDIPTPNTSRSNSVDEDEEKPSISIQPTVTEDKPQSESSPSKDIPTDVADQIKATLAAKRATFVSSSSSSSGSEADFVALDKNDFKPDGSVSINTVSCCSPADALNDYLYVIMHNNCR